MRVTTLHNESSLAEIAERLYANLTDKSRKIAEAELLKTNPDLAKPDVMRPGAIIRVPDVPALKLKPARMEDDPLGQTREVLKKALNSYQGLLAEHLKAERDELRAQTALLEQLTQRELLKEPGQKRQISPALNRTIIELKAKLERRMKKNEVEDRDLPRALDRAVKDLAE